MTTLAADLLGLADSLTKLDPKKPKQATLRRAISTAYYALFHHLIDAGTRRFITDAEKKARPLMGRAFEHGTMKSVSEQIARKEKTLVQRFNLAGVSISQDLVGVAGAFVDLQKARHDADYNLSVRFSRTQAQAFVIQARQALKMWKNVSGDPVATVYLLQMYHQSKR